MAKKKPGVIEMRGEKFTATVLKVLERDRDGRARRFEALYEEESTKIEGGEEFVIVYMNRKTAWKERD